MNIPSERQIGPLADRYISARPWAAAPDGQAAEVIVAAHLRMIGFTRAQVRCAMIDGDIGDDGWFEVQWNGVTIRFPVRSNAANSR